MPASRYIGLSFFNRVTPYCEYGRHCDTATLGATLGPVTLGWAAALTLPRQVGTYARGAGDCAACHRLQVGVVSKYTRFGLRDAHYSKGNIFEASPRPRTGVWQYSGTRNEAR